MRVIIFLFMVSILTGCTKDQTIIVEEVPLKEDKIILTSDVTIHKDAFLAEQTSLDIDKDGEPELVEMYVSPSPVKPNGELLWDDSHLWQLLVKDGKKIFLLYNDQPQFGLIKFWTFAGDSPSILILEDGNGVKLTSYAFKAEEDGFIEEKTIGNQGIPEFRSRFPNEIKNHSIDDLGQEINTSLLDQNIAGYYGAMWSSMSHMYSGYFKFLLQRIFFTTDYIWLENEQINNDIIDQYYDPKYTDKVIGFEFKEPFTSMLKGLPENIIKVWLLCEKDNNKIYLLTETDQWYSYKVLDGGITHDFNILSQILKSQLDYEKSYSETP